MLRTITCVAVLGLATGLTVPATDGAAAIVGTWEGESKCTVPNSPCHDEHVVYEIKADPKVTTHYSLEAYKVVSGERDFMGTLDCRYPAENGTLRCIGRHPDDIWSFSVAGGSITGTLTVGAEKQLYRKVAVSRIR